MLPRMPVSETTKLVGMADEYNFRKLELDTYCYSSPEPSGQRRVMSG